MLALMKDHFLGGKARAVATAGAVISLAAAGSGCVSKATADARVKAAYLAGQQEASTRMQQNQAGGPSVRINGRVAIPVLPWVPGMTLGKALVTAEYSGGEPAEILLLHNGFARSVDVKRLLAGEDVPLQPGDTVIINEAAALTGPGQPPR